MRIIHKHCSVAKHKMYVEGGEGDGRWTQHKWSWRQTK